LLNFSNLVNLEPQEIIFRTTHDRGYIDLFCGITFPECIHTLFYWFGLAGLKVLTLSRRSLKELDQKYDESSKPYFMGVWLLLVVLIYCGIRFSQENLLSNL